MSKKAIILVDGSNFYFKMKDLKLHNFIDFNFSKFFKYLAGKNKLISSTYYIGKIRTDESKKSQILFNKQRKLLAHLKKHKTKYSLGYLLKSDGKYHEKGVDVQMAVDILVAAYENLADHIILVSSDTDLIPSIRKAQQLGKIVEYIGFSHQKSIALVAECKETRLLKLEDIEQFLEKK